MGVKYIYASLLRRYLDTKSFFKTLKSIDLLINAIPLLIDFSLDFVLFSLG
jgi:hypothetical protein